MPDRTATDDVLITRVFDAPRERVFEAWTDPEEVAAWYGPQQFETPRDRIRIDLRVGGRYELTMVQRDGGAEFAIGYEIVELVEPELLVLRSDPMPEVGMHEPTVVRIELHDHGAKTRMTLSDGPYPAGLRTRQGRLARVLRQARGAPGLEREKTRRTPAAQEPSSGGRSLRSLGGGPLTSAASLFAAQRSPRLGAICREATPFARVPGTMTDQFGAKPDARAIRTLLATYWSPQGWIDDPRTPAESSPTRSRRA